jgi:predicted nucleic acid-binding protein
MNYLLDTNVVSEFAAYLPHEAVVAWFERHKEATLYLSVITIGEIQQGIARLPASKKQLQLTAWLNETLLVAYADWIIPIDNNIMLHWGTLTGRLMKKGHKMPIMDAIIAATCLQHNLILVTRNVSDFSQTGLQIINPWETT